MCTPVVLVGRYAARKFFFFLDKHRLRRIKIKDLLLSAVTSEFNELQEEYIPPRYDNTGRVCFGGVLLLVLSFRDVLWPRRLP